jgi:hypothetical protein
MARKLSSDKVLFVALVALSLFGCVMIYSASAVSAAQTGGSPYRYLVKQIVALAAGGLAAFARTTGFSPGAGSGSPSTASASRSVSLRSSARRSTRLAAG